MARNFLPLPFAPYKGPVTSKPFNDGRGGQKGIVVPLSIRWSDYFNDPVNIPDFTVNFSLNVAGPSTVKGTWTVQSVYIDNTDVEFPVYVYFPDTQFAIVCAPNRAGWFEVYTNGRVALMSCRGVTNRSVGLTTQFFFTDAKMTPFTDDEIPYTLPLLRGTDTIQSFAPNQLLSSYGPPALGDATTSGEIDLTGGDVAIPGLTDAVAGTVIVITQVQATVRNLVGTASAVPQAVVAIADNVDGNHWFIDATGVISTGGAASPSALIFNARGNFMFPANRLWKLTAINRQNVAAGIVRATFSLSYVRPI